MSKFTLFIFIFYLFFKKDFIYLLMRDTETQAEGEVGSMQGAPCGTRF